MVCFPKTREASVGQQRAKVQHERQHVLPLRDPVSRLGHNGVQRKDRRRQPGPRHLESAQQPPEKQCADGVEQNVLDVIGQRP